MRIRSTLTLRNDHMVAAREAIGGRKSTHPERLSHDDLAKDSGVSVRDISKFESLQFSGIRNSEDKACKIAVALKISPDEVLPPEHAHESIPSRLIRIDEVALDRLLELKSRHILPSPADTVQDDDELAWVLSVLDKAISKLTEREGVIMKLRTGREGPAMSLRDIGKKFGVTVERVRQIEMKGIRKMSEALEKSGIDVSFMRKAGY